MNNPRPQLPEIGFIKIKDVLKLIPMSKTMFWENINKGRFPRPIKLGMRASAWRVEDIRNLIEDLSVAPATKQSPIKNKSTK